MLKVGLTGGIGSGKTTVCRVFETLGIPVFNADTAARAVMEQDAEVIKGVQELFGTEAYKAGRLQRTYLSSQVFGAPEKLAALNQLVHPATIRFGMEWMEQQISPYVIKEAAILFESGSYQQLDVFIGVTAPDELRIQRAIQRDHLTKEEVEKRMAQQMDQEEKMKRCHYVITNDDKHAVIPQVLEIHQQLLRSAIAKA